MKAGGREGDRFTCAEPGRAGSRRGRERKKKSEETLGRGRRGHGDNLIQLETRRPGRQVPRWPPESSVRCGGAGLVVAVETVALAFLGWGAKGGAQSLSSSPHPKTLRPQRAGQQESVERPTRQRAWAGVLVTPLQAGAGWTACLLSAGPPAWDGPARRVGYRSRSSKEREKKH